MAVSKDTKVSEIYNYATKYNLRLTKEGLDNLTDYIIKANDAKYIYLFAKDINGLSKQNITDLTNAIIASKDLQYIYKLIKISNKKDELIEIIIDSKDINYIRKLIYSNSLSDVYKFNTKLEKIILESKDNILITKYLIWLHDLDLINLIFGNMDKFMLFCLINMEELSLDKEKIINIESEFKQIESVFDFNYVDDNTKDYIKNNLKF